MKGGYNVVVVYICENEKVILDKIVSL